MVFLIEDLVTHKRQEPFGIILAVNGREFRWASILEDYFVIAFNLLMNVVFLQVVYDADVVNKTAALRYKLMTQSNAFGLLSSLFDGLNTTLVLTITHGRYVVIRPFQYCLGSLAYVI